MARGSNSTCTSSRRLRLNVSPFLPTWGFIPPEDRPESFGLPCPLSCSQVGGSTNRAPDRAHRSQSDDHSFQSHSRRFCRRRLCLREPAPASRFGPDAPHIADATYPPRTLRPRRVSLSLA